MITLPAPAKLNLYLHVTGKRDDGYHLLDSLAAFAGIHDTITVEAAADLSLTISGPFGDDLAADDSNLVLKAARKLQEVAGTVAGAHISLVKCLPLASGIGGGSADAAATIRALVRLWGLHPGQHDLSGLALDLGADVPVCLFGQAAFMGGVGEQLTPAGQLPEIPMVLVNPGVDVPTPAVFKARTAGFSKPARFTEPPESAGQLIDMLSDGRGNDLMAPALALEPVVGETLTALNATPGCLFTRMSGSGATCFGFFKQTSEAEAAAHHLLAAHPDWWAVATHLISDTRTLSAEITI